MRTPRFFLFLLCVGIVVPTNHVAAHVLLRDGSIGAVLHIDPDDDPIAGADSRFFFEMTDTTKRFRAQDCICTIDILRDGEPLLSETLSPENDSVTDRGARLTFSFPSTGVYLVRFSGVPKVAEAFQPFALSQNISVAREEKTSATAERSWWSTHMVHLIGALFTAGLLVFFLLRQRALEHTEGRSV